MTIHAISNATIFNGRSLRPPGNLIFRASPGDVVGVEAEARDLSGINVIIEGSGCTLLPGLIDSNIDTAAINRDLHIFASYGITTVLDMSSTEAEILAMRAESDAEPGLPSYLACGPLATAEIAHGNQFYPQRENKIVRSVAEAENFVTSGVNGPSKADYIRVLVDLPGIDSEILAALVSAAHRHGKLAVAHAIQRIGYSRALEAGFDVITLVPIDGLIDADMANRLATRGTACIPTLCRARALVGLLLQDEVDGAAGIDLNFDYALANVKILYDAGVRICAGTEANQTSSAPVSIGESLHEELELLVRSGMSTLDALRAATVVPTLIFGLDDRGVLSSGRRADMLLIEGDPLQDITVTRNIRKVWISGVEVGKWEGI